MEPREPVWGFPGRAGAVEGWTGLLAPRRLPPNLLRGQAVPAHLESRSVLVSNEGVGGKADVSLRSPAARRREQTILGAVAREDVRGALNPAVAGTSRREVAMAMAAFTSHRFFREGKEEMSPSLGTPGEAMVPATGHGAGFSVGATPLVGSAVARWFQPCPGPSEVKSTVGALSQRFL